MKSILSVPILRRNGGIRSLGVLSVDSDLQFEESKLKDERVIFTVNAYSDVVGPLLEK